MNNRLFMLIAVILAAISVAAQQEDQFVCDGISYHVTDSVAHTVEVAPSVAYRTLTAIDIPAMVTDGGGMEWKVTAIGDEAFCMSELQSVTLPEGLARIGHEAFYFSKLEHVDLPKSLTTIGGWAFGETRLSGTLVIPDNVTAIGGCAFIYTPITKLQLGSSVREIAIQAFAGCYWLTDVGELPSSLTDIEHAAFYNCGLTRVSIPGNVRYIGSCAFCQNKNLQTIELHEGVDTIDVEAFAYTSIKNVTLPASVSCVAQEAFAGTANLDAIDVAAGNPCFSSVDGILFSKQGDILVICPGGKSGEYRLPDGVAAVANSAFSGCTELTSIILNDAIKQVGIGVFDNCYALDSIYVPNGIEVWRSQLVSTAWYKRQPMGVVYLGPVAFGKGFGDECLRIKTGTRCVADGGFTACGDWCEQVILPKGLVYIGGSAFDHFENLKTLRVPSTVKYISDYAFSNCTSLSIINMPENLQKMGHLTIGSCIGLEHLVSYSPVLPEPRDWNRYTFFYNDVCTLYCPQGSVDAYNKDIYSRAFNVKEIGPLGDVNNDFAADINDVNQFFNVLLRRLDKPKGLDFFLHDLNGDYQIDIDDVNELVNIMLGK